MKNVVLIITMMALMTFQAFGTTNLTPEVRACFSEVVRCGETVACRARLAGLRAELGLSADEFSDLLIMLATNRDVSAVEPMDQLDALTNTTLSASRLGKRAAYWLGYFGTTNSLSALANHVNDTNCPVRASFVTAYVAIDRAGPASCLLVSNLVANGQLTERGNRAQLYLALDQTPGVDGLIKEKRINDLFLDMTLRDSNTVVFLDDMLVGRMTNYCASSERLAAAAFALGADSSPYAQSHFLPVYARLSALTNLPSCRNDPACVRTTSHSMSHNHY